MKVERGRTFVITGGKSGLGMSAVTHLYHQGANVVILDLPPFNFTHKNEAFLSNDTERVLLCSCDVTKDEQIETAISQTVSKFGAIHGLINCAGILGPMPVLHPKTKQIHSLEAFQKVLQVNVTGSFAVLRRVAFQMSQQEPVNEDGERGVLINVASIAAYETGFGGVAYGASKGAVLSMTLPIAREMAQYGIRCVCICPGYFDTSMARSVPQPLLQSVVKEVPFPKRMGQGPEFAKLCQTIIETVMMNGEAIRIDGAIRIPFTSRL